MKNIWLIAFFLLGASCMNNNPVQQAPKDSKEMPAFDILLTDTTTKINSKKIPTGEPIVLFFFGPDCPYCQKLTEEITHRMDEFKDIRLYMVSAANFHDIQLYDDKYDLKKYNNVVVGQDYKGIFFTYYQAPGFPYLVVYDKKKQLDKIIIGGISADSLKTVITKLL